VQFSIEQTFELPLATVEDAYLDPSFLARMGDIPKLGRPQLLRTATDGPRVTQEVRYAFNGDVSSAVRRVVDPAKLTWVVVSTTDRSTHRTDFQIRPDNYANLLRCQGAYTLTDRGATTVRVQSGEIRVGVPLVGGKVERVIVSGWEDTAAAEVELLTEWARDRTV
jgi:hypothetical protein